eukprot:scaffold4406_cov112-Isochrysis_galbana.AAC.18
MQCAVGRIAAGAPQRLHIAPEVGTQHILLLLHNLCGKERVHVKVRHNLAEFPQGLGLLSLAEDAVADSTRGVAEDGAEPAKRRLGREVEGLLPETRFLDNHLGRVWVSLPPRGRG